MMEENNKIPFVNTIQCGDNLTLIKSIPDKSIDLIITSPPYYLQRDYGGGSIGGEKKVESYIDALLELFGECVRVIKPEGSIVYNIGDKYIHSSLLLAPYRFAIKALDKYNVILVNDITWIKPNPTPRQYKKRLVSSTEPFFHFVTSKDYIYNIDEFNKKDKKIKKSQNTNMGAKYFKLIKESQLTQDQKDLAAKELTEVIEKVKNGEIDSFRMKIKGIHSLPFGGQQGGRMQQLDRKGFTIIEIYGNNIKRDIIESPVESIKGNIHPAIFPEKIIIELINLLTPRNGIVLDPYMGSGTTAIASIKAGRNYIGFEIIPEFCDFADNRIKKLI